MMLISELVAHLQNIAGMHGDIGVRIDADFFGDAQPRSVEDVHIGRFDAEGGAFNVVLYPQKIVTEANGNA
jgi:hypothetical protein